MKTPLFFCATLLIIATLAASGCVGKTVHTPPPAKKPVATKPAQPKKNIQKPPAEKPKQEQCSLPLKATEPGLLYIEVGSYDNEPGASKVRDMLLEQGYKGSRMDQNPSNGQYRVQAGVFPDMECAQRALKKIVKDHPKSFIVSEE